MSKEDIIQLIEKDKWMMEILKTVEKLGLPDWWIGAGFVRSKVWDYLHAKKTRTPLPDIDVIYFDPKAPIENERKHWKVLKDKYPDFKWPVTNTALRRSRISSRKYKNAEDALSEWVETATCIGVSSENGKLKIITPHGVDDLVSLRLKPTKGYVGSPFFEKRIKEKSWLKKWPKLKAIVYMA
ncbi:MAG: hypothetical protein UU21_C0001G0091 [Candidatus Levybacteria bacterium GW2011_GWA2_40_8]|nr:MAG: hypothetical protein UU21_C0001G0091 [Candidatus Levybacteria bacterium GW2011_GWA2_40_8]